MRNTYLERYAWPDTLIDKRPNEDLKLIITIPCFNEISIIPCLESLLKCPLPADVSIEVIAIINESEVADKEITTRNTACYREAEAWSQKHSSGQLFFHVLYKKLPKKHAGVGLARKIVMDEAARRFEQVGNDGIIVCYDADCSCDTNYMTAINNYFDDNPKCPGAAIHYEHPLFGNEEPEVYQAIIDYELFLRYYVNALRFAGYPHAYQTIGSSMAVRSHVYQKQGGMNKRKAGEDFYFLHKVIPLGNFGEINTTHVIPSPRQSDRVPFGTGRAVNQWLAKNSLSSYAIETFVDLAELIKTVPLFYSTPADELCPSLPDSVQSFLKSHQYLTEIEKIKQNAGSAATFRKQFYQWFDGFKVLKYVHDARDNFYPNQPIKEVAAKLLSLIMDKPLSALTSRQLLEAYRKMDTKSQ